MTQLRLLIKQRVPKYMKNYFGFTHSSSFPLHEGQLSIMTVVDSIKCRCAHSGMTGQVEGFQNPGVCLQAFPSFLPHPLSALLLVPFFARSLTLVPRSLLLNRTKTLATQASCERARLPIAFRFLFFFFCYCYCCFVFFLYIFYISIFSFPYWLLSLSSYFLRFASSAERGSAIHVFLVNYFTRLFEDEFLPEDVCCIVQQKI